MKAALTPAAATMVVLLLANVAGYSATLSSGSATIDYNKTAWDSLAADLGAGPNVLTLNSYFDQAASNARTSTQIQSGAAIAGSSYTGEIYAMNGPTVTNLSGRITQPTTFNYTSGNPQLETGSIGLGGIARFAVSPAAGGGVLLYGDFTLQYDASRIAAPYDGTGWYLKGNIPPAAAGFDILNVSVVETAGTLTISGQLGVSYEVANFLYSTPSDQGKNVGNFTFTGQVVPEPSVGALMLSTILGFVGVRRRNGSARQ